MGWVDRAGDHPTLPGEASVTGAERTPLRIQDITAMDKPIKKRFRRWRILPSNVRRSERRARPETGGPVSVMID
jgi:hypothetical protein